MDCRLKTKALDGKGPIRILIVKLSAIGDVVHALPFLEALKHSLPAARIDWVVEEGASQIIVGHPALSRIMVSRRKTWRKLIQRPRNIFPVIREIADFLRVFRSQDYDLVIDLQGLLKSGLLVALSKGRRKVGMSGSREGAGLFLNEPSVPVNYEQHAIDRYLNVAEYLGFHVDHWGGHIPILEHDKRFIDQILASKIAGKKPLVAINPIAKWTTKLWDPVRFATLADRISHDLTCEVVFTGSEEDRRIVRNIEGRMGVRALNMAGKTNLKELAYLYSRCKLLVTTDTGPMHLASAMGCPVVALFGPTSPWRTGPYGGGHRVIRAGVECSPCFRKRCDHMTCMGEISVESVFKGVREALQDQTLKDSAGM